MVLRACLLVLKVTLIKVRKNYFCEKCFEKYKKNCLHLKQSQPDKLLSGKELILLY